MSGGEVCRWHVRARLGLAMVLVMCGTCWGCDGGGQEASTCRALGEQNARNVCNAFAPRLDAEEAAEASDLVLRSFCGGRERRVALPIARSSQSTPAAQVRATLVRAIDQRWHLAGRADGDCVFSVELLAPRGDRTDIGGLKIFQTYHPQRDALAVLRRPREVVTPLDFSTEPPRTSVEALGRLPQLYPHQLRHRRYLQPNTPVQPMTVRGYVLRKGQLAAFRYHRVRAQRVDDQALVDAVHRAGQWFETMRDTKHARFYYEYDPYTDTHVDSSYNLLRHAGSTWAILQAYGLTRDKKLRALANYALAWLEDHSRTEKKDGRTIRYPVSPQSKEAKLGGAGLWLLALSEYTRLTGDTSHLELIQQIANYIYLAQDPATGRFNSYHDADGLRVPQRASDYYPGEAMFGLHRARPFLSDIPVCEVSEKGLRYLLAQAPHKLPVNQYRFVNQWNVYTIREHRRDCSDTQFDWVWRRDLDHMLTHAATVAQAPVMAGAYRADDGSLSTSPTRLEALSVICTELGRHDAAVAAKCDPVLRRVAGMQLSFQHRPANDWLWPDARAVDGGFAHSLDDETIRIDFTQHHLSAMYNTIDFLRHISPHKNSGARASLLGTNQGWPFNLVGDSVCGRHGSGKCL